MISKPQLLLKLARGIFVAVETRVHRSADRSLTATFFNWHATRKTTIDSMDKRDSRNLFYSWVSPVPSYDSTRIACCLYKVCLFFCGFFFLLFVRLRYMGKTTKYSQHLVLSSCHVTNWKRHDVSSAYPPWALFFSSFFSHSSKRSYPPMQPPPPLQSLKTPLPSETPSQPSK